ncbi:MAG: ubiquinol-cytochrome c reductase iron-sulfur subunit [Deltaproteobacteria bacterium]|nr:ubiquinol-cytochrome c reductase iron-sulfur subunit [Deltaproteobacteria bacterium]
MEMNSTLDSDKKSFSRRRLIVYAWMGAAAVVAGELIVGTFAFLWPRKTQGKSEKIFIAGKVKDFKVGEVVYFRKEKTIIKKMEEGFLAFSAVCPHLNCVVNWNEVLKTFECPCHGAKFNPNGEVLEGPPPRPLDLYKLQVVDEKLVVDTGSLVMRKNFDPSQIVKG